MSALSTSALSNALLAYLSSKIGGEPLAFDEEPTPISGGFDTAIYGFRLQGAEDDFSSPLILRIYRDGGAAQARFETIVQNTVADQGYPTPRILLTCEDASILGGAFTIMGRIIGIPMLDKLMSFAMFRMPTILARIHANLHTLDVHPLQDELRRANRADYRGTTFEGNWLALIEHARLEGLRVGHEWVISERPPTAAHTICHGDLHPLNIMLSGDDVAGVLDWPNARIEDPAWDIGATVALMSHGPVELPPPAIPFVNMVRRRLVASYLREYTKLRPLDADAVRYFEAARLLGFLIEVGVVRRSRAGDIPAVTKPTAFDSPRVLQGITRRFTEITGVPPSLPAPP
jgi:aminoglycoside phosphotransferase (APT) family kinase protein